MKFIICMITGCQQKLCAVAVLLVVTSAPTLAAPTGKILITLDKHQNPVVEYIVGPEVSELTFPENNPRIHQLVRSNSWLPENKCAAIESGRLLRKSSACRFRYTLTWDSAPIDRLYPPLVRLVNGGVMIFTEYPLVSVDGRGLPMEVLAPAGMVVAFWGQKAKTRVAIPATVFQDDPRGWIYIGPDKFVNEAAANMLIDDGMPSTVAAVITQVSADVLKLFTKKFDVAPAGKPSFYLEWSRRDRPGRSFQADVVPGGVIRLGLSGEGWKNASERDIATFRNVAAHEIAHFWNSGIFKPIVPAMPWLYEGNAELLSIAALYQLKVYDAQAASDRINNSLNECLLTIGDSAWSKFEDRNRGTIPYTCGLALQIAIAGAHHREHPREDVFTFWRAVWRESPRYDENLVLAFMGKTGLANQAAQLRSLLSSDESFRVALLRMFNNAGLATMREITAPEVLKGSLGRNLFSALMRLDCAGAVEFFTYPEYLQVNNIKGCKSFAPGMKVRTVQGADILRNPAAAVSAIRAACDKSKPIDIETRDGPVLSLLCGPADLSILPTEFQPIRVETKGLQNFLDRGL